jgi:hypothetical protein
MELPGSATAMGPTERDLASAELDDEVNEIAGGLNVLYGRMVDVAARCLAEPGLWRGVGIRSLEHWLCWRMGVSTHVAKQVTVIARRAAELPVSISWLEEGRLSLAQVAEIAKLAPWWADEQAAGLAEHMTVAQIRRLLKATHFDQFGDHPKPDETGDASADDARPGPDPVVEHERCSFGYDDHGRFFLHLLTDQLTGEIIEKALAEARDALFQGGQADVTWVQALQEVAQRSLDTVESPARRDRFKLHFHLDVHGGAVDAANVPIPESIANYLTCDGAWDPVFTNNAIPINVGRGERIVPERTRRVVQLRDGGCCRVPGCRQARWLEIHHIVHWLEHGVTETWNLVTLCPYHHRLHHKGELGIEGNADVAGDLRFADADGQPMSGSGAKPTGKLKPERLCPPLRTWRCGTGEWYDMNLVTWRTPDRDPTLRHLYERDRQPAAA